VNGRGPGTVRRAAATAEPPHRSPGALQEFASGVFAYVQPDGSWFINNTGFIASADGVLSIDSCATEARTRAYLAAIRSVTTRPITTLVNTHHHADHTNGNGLLGAATIVAHVKCRDQMARTAWPPPAQLFGTVDWGAVAPVLPGICFQDRLELHAGARRIELLHFGMPAHTTNDVVAWLPEDRILFAGDLAFNGGTPFALSGSIAGWLEVLGTLGTLAPDIIIPGHGAPGGPELLRETASYLEFVKQAASQAHAAGVPPLRAAAELDLGDYASLSDSERIVGNLHRAYAELDGHERGCPVDDPRCFADMVAYNGGRPLRCLA
jgi:cyclase